MSLDFRYSCRIPLEHLLLLLYLQCAQHSKHYYWYLVAISADGAPYQGALAHLSLKHTLVT